MKAKNTNKKRLKFSGNCIDTGSDAGVSGI